MRAIGQGHSNTSVVIGEELVLKIYRLLAAGDNPELELLRFLSEHGFENAPPLLGSYAHSGRLIDATLGILSGYVPAESDGWTFALSSLRDDPARFLGHVGRLGEVTGAMHVLLASDSSDPSFAAEEPSAESFALLAATLDEEIEAVFAQLPDDPVLAPIAGRGEEVRERVRLLSSMAGSGRVIRHHGNLHLGDVLWTGDDWFVLDFEGPPDRSLAERRRKLSPLRDVASMLRSLAYAEAATVLMGGDAAARKLGGAGARALPFRLLHRRRAERARAGRGGCGRAAAGDLRAREGGRRAAPRTRPPARLGADPGGGDRAPARATVRRVVLPPCRCLASSGSCWRAVRASACCR